MYHPKSHELDEFAHVLPKIHPTATYARAMTPLTAEEFEGEVSRALDQLPPELAGLMDNVVVVVEDANDEEPDLLGLYEGLPLTERDGYGLFDLPDRITVYRLALCAHCQSREELVEEITITVVHEIAHHFGIDDDRLHELGWA